MSRPQIAVRDGNYKNRGELFLEHTFNGVELQVSEAQDTLTHLHKMWNRPVHIQTVLDGHRATMSFDGSEHLFETGEAVEVVDESED
jgi:stage V sporulation protein R